jgi:hypothetical protein
LKNITWALAALLLTTAAYGQTVPPEEVPPPPVPEAGQAAPAAEVQPSAEESGPASGIRLSDRAEPQRRAPKRFSPLSAGPGGPLLVLTEIVTGVVAGGILGGTTRNPDLVYLGVLSGGLILGGAAAAYSYSVPVSMGAAMLSTLGSVSGAMLGLGIGSYATGDFDITAALLFAAFSQLGVGAALAAGYGDDFTVEDAGLAATAAMHATIFTGLAMWLASASGANVDARPVLFAPAVGMALGTLIATAVDLPASRIFKIALMPVGVGVGLLYLGGLAQSPVVAPATVMVGMAVTLGLTVLFTQPPPAEDEAAVAPRGQDGSLLERVVAIPMVMPVPGSRAMAAGPGLAVRF